MKRLKILVPVILSIAWYLLLSRSLVIGDSSLPPIGRFFSPSTGFWKNVLHPDAVFPKTIQGLADSSQVFFDERWVPHIFARSSKDAYYIQGYVHAMMRLWQMDFASRAAEGRISELIGPKALEFDKNKRRKGLKESALKSVEAWKCCPEAFQLVQAYSDGFNAYLKTLRDADLPIEFKLMNYKPEPWSPYRSSLFHKSMSEVLCGRDMDVELTNARNFFGDDFNFLFEEMDSLTDPVIPKGTKWDYIQSIKKDSSLNLGLFENFDLQTEKGISGLGSNNWAVGPSKSVSGNPILCNDPHLSLTLPSIWFEQQIHTPEMNVYGVTFPGIPGVVIGFNKDIAWGVTNAGWDVMDWYKIKWKDAAKTAYELDGQWIQTETRIEIIKVKGKADVIDTVLLTKWGPVVYTDAGSKKQDLAMHWVIQDPSDKFEMNTFFDLNKGTNYTDYRAAITQFPYPAQNFAFASASGDVAISVQGRMPIKKNQQGRFVLDGSDSKNAWQGFLEMDEVPKVLNPSRGFISSANQRSTDLTFPNYYNNGDFRDYRGTMINRLLTNKEHWSVDDMKALQYNNYSLKAETAMPLLLQQIDSTNLSEYKKAIYSKLKVWNYNYDSAAIEPVYFDVWFGYFHKMVWDEILQDSTKKYIAIPSDEATINCLRLRPTSKYFDIVQTPAIETARDLVNLAFDSLVNFTNQQLKVKDWAAFKDASISHLAKIPAFGVSVRTSGSADIINAHAKTFGPSWRMIVELGKTKINAFGIYPGGQSGNPGSPHYREMIDTWSKGGYYELQFMDAIPSENSVYKTIQFKCNESK